MKNYENIAVQIREARKSAGMSQRELARLTGVQQVQISKIENGLVDPRLSTLQEIAHALNLEIVLVPRQFLSAVQGITRQDKKITGPAYRLEEEDDD